VLHRACIRAERTTGATRFVHVNEGSYFSIRKRINLSTIDLFHGLFLFFISHSKLSPLAQANDVEYIYHKEELKTMFLLLSRTVKKKKLRFVSTRFRTKRG
jgi:hypothetical protein